MRGWPLFRPHPLTPWTPNQSGFLPGAEEAEHETRLCGKSDKTKGRKSTSEPEIARGQTAHPICGPACCHGFIRSFVHRLVQGRLHPASCLRATVSWSWHQDYTHAYIYITGHATTVRGKKAGKTKNRKLHSVGPVRRVTLLHARSGLLAVRSAWVQPPAL